MDYSRVTPRARSGTTGISEDISIGAGQGVWISPPDRLAAVTVAVHIPENSSAEFTIECTCSRAEKIGQDGNGGYWDAVEEENPTYTKSKVVMLCNAVTGIRVRCIDATTEINVCFCG